ncbi:MAG: RNA polymerase subunit sigma-70, partial [Erythrobacter sp.]|nr:RNA polymerase subunit sigma-70 [Erythrobacter sp.]
MSGDQPSGEKRSAGERSDFKRELTAVVP